MERFKNFVIPDGAEHQFTQIKELAATDDWCNLEDVVHCGELMCEESRCLFARVNREHLREYVAGVVEIKAEK